MGGLELTLTRRELLGSLVGLISSPLLHACDEQPPPRPIPGSLLGPDREHGHRLRDGRFGPEAFTSAPTRRVGVAILGGGPAGLSAGWRLAQRGRSDYRIFELEARVGGTSVHGESGGLRFPWGAHYLPLPQAHQVDLIALLEQMGALEGRDEAGLPLGAEHLLVREPDERIFYRGYWYRGLYPYAGASSEELSELERFRERLDAFAGRRGADGKRAFSLPLRTSSTDPSLLALDRLTAAEWLDREGLRSERLRWLVDYACRDDYGLRLEQTSAWAALFYWAARMPGSGQEARPLITWPEGNGALVEQLLAPSADRVETNRLVVDVRVREEGVELDLLDTREDAPLRVLADACIVALPHFIAKRVVAPLRERAPALVEAERFSYGGWMVAQLHLRGRPQERGYAPAWDNVLYESPALGYVTATHQRGRDFGPTIWTYYLPL
ncbi:MAG: FAD-dependent oxidoreductase, partial [Myxococcales bacterium]|nr:FAD-dependent oxidoreductase [Myxococcales bacterium]